MDNIVWIFKQIAYLSLNASILALIIILVKKIFNKVLTPKWHYYIWFLLIIRLLVPFYIESPTSIYNLFSTTSEKINIPQKIIQNINYTKDTVNKSSTSSNGMAISSSNSNLKKQSSSNSVYFKESETKNYDFIIKLIFYIWLIGMAIMLIYTIFINILFALKLKHYKKSNNLRITAILKNCKKIMHVRHSISIFTTNKLRTPSLYGLFKIKILTCETYMEKLSDDEIKYIFLHELSHYKRKDILINWVIVLLQIIHFFNPIIWYAFYKMHEDCEISCDAAALNYINKEEYQNYGSTIIKLLKLFSESNFIPVTAGISKNKSSYKRRIIMISNFKKSSFVRTIISLTLISLVSLTGLTSCSSVSEKTSLNSDKKASTELINTSNTTQTNKTKSNTSITTNTTNNTAKTVTSTTNVSSKVKLYEGTYFDNKRFGEYTLKNYYEVVISNVKDNSFDFTIYKVFDEEKNVKEVVFATNTAIFTGDGTKADFYGKNYTLHFTFPDNHHAYPAVTDMSISGFTPIEGKTFVNNTIPGHEFG